MVIPAASLLVHHHTVAMPLKTTVIGSYPKPDYLHIPSWFEINDHTALLDTHGKFLEEKNSSLGKRMPILCIYFIFGGSEVRSSILPSFFPLVCYVMMIEINAKA